MRLGRRHGDIRLEAACALAALGFGPKADKWSQVPVSRGAGTTGTTNFCSGISPVGASRAPPPAGNPGASRACRRNPTAVVHLDREQPVTVTAAEHAPATFRHPADSNRGPGPPPPAVRLRRNIPSRRRPGPGPRVPSFTPFVVDAAVELQCCKPARRRRHILLRIGAAVDQFHVIAAFGQIDQLPAGYEPR